MEAPTRDTCLDPEIEHVITRRSGSPSPAIYRGKALYASWQFTETVQGTTHAPVPLCSSLDMSNIENLVKADSIVSSH